MLLESIKLENFRQFRNESIDFAQGQDGKNVTIIIGENGTGKTTFAQAFFWCMYGETEFSDKNMVMDKLQCDEKEASSVILESIPVESIDTLIEFGLNNANDDYYDDVYLADGCSTCKTEIFRSFLTQVATNTDEIFFELSNKLLRQALDEQLSKLTLKEAEVIKLRYGYYGKERTLEEVGKQFGVTRERIRQIETKAIRKLRHPSRAKHLRDFL